jgi:hypothetical protein
MTPDNFITMPENKVSADAADNNHYLFLEHDHNEIITVQNTEKGVRLKEVYKTEIF